MICHWYSQPSYFFFAPDLPELLYYSHIPAFLLALIVGAFIFLNAPNRLPNKLLFLISICFSFWVLINLTAWTNIRSDIVLFSWTFFGVMQALISVLSIYFIYTFLTNKDAPKIYKVILLTLIMPVLLLAGTDFSLSGFNLDQCDAFDYEGVTFLTYYSFLGLIAMAWILVLLVKHFRNAETEFKQQILIMGCGIELFLFSFFGMVYLGSIGAIADVYEDSQIEFYGLFGMTFFMVMMGVLIVKFRSFKIGTHAANALVVALLILISSQYTYTNSTTTTITLTTITLVFTAIAGILLIRSVKKEIKQREELEVLTNKLEKANKRLKELDQMKSEFVSIASHQLRSPLTSIRGYASMLLEGSFGNLTEKGKEAVERISESSRFMALSVEDYLNVSRIEAGRMKYEMSDFNLKDMAEHLVDDLRQQAIKKGLALTSKTSELSGNGMVHGDIGKTNQIIHNLIDNALKYTPAGTVMVRVYDNLTKKKVYVEIVDSGVGMNKDAIDEVFEKFIRARNANQVNVTGTGLGLYVAKKMAEGMNGTITADSEGEGKGSVFTIEMPMAK